MRFGLWSQKGQVGRGFGSQPLRVFFSMTAQPMKGIFKFMSENGFSSLVRRVYHLLRKTQPILGEYDVAWWAPYFIPRQGEWHATHFILYNGKLYGRIRNFPDRVDMAWHLATGEIEFFRGLAPCGPSGEREWHRVFSQVERRLTSALKDFSRYNSLVSHRLPMACRTGKIQRNLTWPKSIKTAIPRAEIGRAKRALCKAGALPLLAEMTKKRYLETVAIAYDAGFKDLRSLSPLEKYRKRADGRHGGLLDLPDSDAEAFSKWYRSDSWSGTHPWEIVFGHPHGIMLSPRFHKENGRWSFWLWVRSESWYGHAVRMAIAMGERDVPFEFQEGQKVLDALEGLDEVEVGPAFGRVRYEELRQRRPDAPKSIRWDPIPMLGPITRDQRDRVKLAEKEKPGG